MKAKSLIIASSLLAAALIFGCKGAQKNSDEGQNTLKEGLSSESITKRYPFEKGIINSTTEVAGIETKTTTYFAKWGEWEAIETIVPMKIMGQDLTSRTIEIIKGDEHWSIDLNEKTGTHFSRSRSINTMGIDVNNLTNELLGKMNMEKLGEEEYLGFKCQKFRVKSDNGATMDYLMLGNLMMQMEGEAMGMKTKMKVISIDKIDPPKEKFEIPEGVTISEE